MVRLTHGTVARHRERDRDLAVRSRHDDLEFELLRERFERLGDHSVRLSLKLDQRVRLQIVNRQIQSHRAIREHRCQIFHAPRRRRQEQTRDGPHENCQSQIKERSLRLHIVGAPFVGAERFTCCILETLNTGFQ
jgi:hypothetical protein